MSSLIERTMNPAMLTGARARASRSVATESRIPPFAHNPQEVARQAKRRADRLIHEYGVAREHAQLLQNVARQPSITDPDRVPLPPLRQGGTRQDDI
jgi:hypothetical protein